MQLFGQFFGRRLTANFVKHLAACPHKLVDRFDHMHRDTDRAGLIGDRARDRLTDPPCGIGRELISTAIFELVDRFHEADVTFLNEIKELQATVGIFFGNRNNEAQVGFDHFFLRLTGLFFALLDLTDDATELRDIKADILTDLGHFSAQLVDFIGGALDKHLPATARFLRHVFHPCRVKLATAVFINEFLTVDAGLIRQFDHVGVNLHDPAVDTVELVNQRFDTVVVQVKLVHEEHDFGAQFLVFLLCFVREAAVFVQRGRNTAVLHLRELCVGIGDLVEGFEHAGL